MENFTLRDEGNYWEISDEKISYAQFYKYHFFPDAVRDALSSVQNIQGETPGTLANRIENILMEKF